VVNDTHELRMPLTLLLSRADRLLDSGGLDDAQLTDLRDVRTGALTVLKRVNDLLDVARLDDKRWRAEPADHDLALVVSEAAGAFAALAASRGLRWEMRVPASWPARIDEEKLSTVVSNLLANAVKFAPPGGVVRCSLAPCPCGARIEVADSGPGVPPAERAEVFGRFRQGGSATDAPAGSGLGLAIARQLCSLQGGRLWVAEAPEGGALFTLELPAPPPAGICRGPSVHQLTAAALRRELAADMLAAELAIDERHTSSAPPEVGQHRRGRVLLIGSGDELAALTDLLAPRYSLRATDDGELGVHAALTWTPDVVVAHAGVAAVRDGSVLRRLRAEARLTAVSVLAVIPAQERELRVRLLRAGARDTLVTPLAPEDLLPRVDNLVLLARIRQHTERTHRRETLARSARPVVADAEAHALRGGDGILA
jgi:CheY-like chemotaxis protein